MTLTRPGYCTRDDVLRAMDVAPSLRARTLVDRAVAGAVGIVEGTLKRRFSPSIGTRYFDWPDRAGAPAWKLYLDENELAALTAVTAGGVTVALADVNLEPNTTGPPYDRVELNLGTSASFTVGSTQQRNIALTGTFGYQLDTAPAGALSGAINASVTSLAVTDSSQVSPGDLLIAGTEYLLVTETAMVTTGQTLQTPIDASSATVTIAVTTGSAYHAGEIVLLDSERMEIQDIAGNSLTVKRAVQGSVLATHTGSTIYAPRTLTVVRGAQGSTAASHLDAITLTKHQVPPLVQQLVLGEALNLYAQMTSGFARQAGTGAATMAQGGQLDAIRARAKKRHGRGPRIWAV